MSLQAELDALALSAADHVLGVAVTDILENRIVAAANADRPFQLASMFKIPVLVTAFRHIEAGKLALDQRYTVRAGQKLVGSGILAYLDDGLAPTLHDLLTLMIIVSDNTATDMVLDLLGGPETVDQMLRDLGITDIHVRHRTRDLLWAVFPADALVLTEAEFARYTREHNLQRVDHLVAPGAKTNTGTPAALNQLLALIERGTCASADSCAAMRTILKRQTFNHRLPRSWPDDVEFAHKTGTLGDMRGDSGILYLPDRTLAISGIVQAVNTPLPLTPAQEDAGDALLARVGELVYCWASGN